MAEELKEGKTAPDFILPSTGGVPVRLRDFQGKKNIILYFYPKDNTPGCTQEACDFRDSIQKFKKLDAEVLGVSFDTLDSHEKFIGKFKLPFALLSDAEKKIAQKYGVYKEKSLYGRKFMGIERSTFVIDKNLKIRKVYRKVRVEDHIPDVLGILKQLEA